MKSKRVEKVFKEGKISCSHPGCREQVSDALRLPLCSEHAWLRSMINYVYMYNVALVVANIVCIFYLGQLSPLILIGMNSMRAHRLRTCRTCSCCTCIVVYGVVKTQKQVSQSMARHA